MLNCLNLSHFTHNHHIIQALLCRKPSIKCYFPGKVFFPSPVILANPKKDTSKTLQKWKRAYIIKERT